jgi:hypothetical protein
MRHTSLSSRPRPSPSTLVLRLVRLPPLRLQAVWLLLQVRGLGAIPPAHGMICGVNKILQLLKQLLS